jgi:hypothetical protein
VGATNSRRGWLIAATIVLRPRRAKRLEDRKPAIRRSIEVDLHAAIPAASGHSNGRAELSGELPEGNLAVAVRQFAVAGGRPAPVRRAAEATIAVGVVVMTVARHTTPSAFVEHPDQLRVASIARAAPLVSCIWLFYALVAYAVRTVRMSFSDTERRSDGLSVTRALV